MYIGRHISGCGKNTDTDNISNNQAKCAPKTKFFQMLFIVYVYRIFGMKIHN